MNLFTQHNPPPRLASVLEILLTRHGLTERSAPEQYLGQKLDVAAQRRPAARQQSGSTTACARCRWTASSPAR